ncbi:MAG TPA: transposase [Hyphomicrobiaceae bacterium]
MTPLALISSGCGACLRAIRAASMAKSRCRVAYAKGAIHTQGLENFWSLLKRSIKGTYVSVEPFHLGRYLDEQAFRFNEREGGDGDRFRSVLSAVSGKRLTYRELIGYEPRSTPD